MLLEGFDGIFVINLATRADRRTEIDQQLRRLGLSLDHERVILFPAVRPDDADGFPSIGARGCFMSHFGVLRMAQAKGMKDVLILEDDCDFSKDAVLQTPQVIGGLQQLDWALFYGGALNTFDSTSSLAGLRVLRPASGLMGSHCIAVRGNAISQVAAYFEAMLQRPPGSPAGGPMHVDGAYSWFRKDHPELTTVIAAPEWAFQRSSATDVHDKRWYDRWPVINQLAAHFRKIKNAMR